MANQMETFSCFIQDEQLGDKFSAKVTVRKRLPIRQALQRDGTVELVDIYIEPISANLRNHHHFVVMKLDGRGLYIVRDAKGNEQHRREGSIWELGNFFGMRISEFMRRSS
jgi:hypothetical protein